MSRVTTSRKEVVIGVCSGLVVGFVIFMVLLTVDKRRDDQQVTGQHLDTKVLGWKVSTTGDEAFRPKPGYKFVIVDSLVQSRLTKGEWFAPALQSYVQDETGAHYQLSPLLLDKPFDAREYAAGETATGELSYQVPLQSEKLKWCYQTESDAVAICVDLRSDGQ